MQTDEDTQVEAPLEEATQIDEAQSQEQHQESEATVAEESTPSLTDVEDVGSVQEASPSVEELQAELERIRAERDEFDKRVRGQTKSWQEERDARLKAEAEAERIRQEAEARQVGNKKYDSRHPEYADFQSKVPYIEQFLDLKQDLAEMDSEHAERIANRFAQRFDESDIRAYMDMQREQARMQQKMSTPEGLREMLREVAREEYGSARQYEETVNQQAMYYNRLFDENDEYIAPYRDSFLAAVKQGADPHRLIAEYKAEASNAKLKELMAKAKEGEARSKAAKGNATVARDVEGDRPFTEEDIYDAAVKLFNERYHGISRHGHNDFYAILEEVKSQYQK